MKAKGTANGKAKMIEYTIVKEGGRVEEGDCTKKGEAKGNPKGKPKGKPNGPECAQLSESSGAAIREPAAAGAHKCPIRRKDNVRGGAHRREGCVSGEDCNSFAASSLLPTPGGGCWTSGGGDGSCSSREDGSSSHRRSGNSRCSRGGSGMRSTVGCGGSSSGSVGSISGSIGSSISGSESWKRQPGVDTSCAGDSADLASRCEDERGKKRPREFRQDLANAGSTTASLEQQKPGLKEVDLPKRSQKSKDCVMAFDKILAKRFRSGVKVTHTRTCTHACTHAHTRAMRARAARRVHT